MSKMNPNYQRPPGPKNSGDLRSSLTPAEGGKQELVRNFIRDFPEFIDLIDALGRKDPGKLERMLNDLYLMLKTKPVEEVVKDLTGQIESL